MLRGLRKATTNWLGKAVMATVMGVLILSFAVWGIGDIFRGFGRSSLAKVGSTELSIEQFRQTYNDRLQQLGRRLGRPITPEQARLLGLDRQLLGELISEMALDERVRQLGLNVPDAEVTRRIMEDPVFRGPNGRFDASHFQQLIRSAGYTEARYVAEQRRVLLRRQIANAMGGNIIPPVAAESAAFRFDNEQRAIEYAVLNAQKAGDVPEPTPEELAKYFETRKALFRAPEYRKLVLLALTPEDQARWIEVSDADAQRYFEDHRSRYVTPERRRLQQIVFPSAEEAKAASDRLKGGLTFAALAAERKLSEADIDLGTLTKAELIDPKIAEAAFSLPEGGTSEPLQGQFNVVLLHVLKIEPQVAPTYAELAAQIKREIALERARAEILTKHDKIEDERAGGQSLSEIAPNVGASARTIEAIDRSGRDPEGAQIPDLPPGLDVLSAAFAGQVGVEADPLQFPGGGYLWFEVVAITPSRDRSLEEVRDRVVARWRDDQIVERLRAKAAGMVEKLKAGVPFAEVAATEILPIQTATGLRRGKPSEGIPAALVDEAFRVAKEGPGSSEGSSPTERIVFRVTDVTVPQFDAGSPEGKRIDEAMRSRLSDDVLAQYITQLQAEVGVTINQQAFRQATGATPAEP